jgi:hypothetical protein
MARGGCCLARKRTTPWGYWQRNVGEVWHHRLICDALGIPVFEDEGCHPVLVAWRCLACETLVPVAGASPTGLEAAPLAFAARGHLPGIVLMNAFLSGSKLQP